MDNPILEVVNIRKEYPGTVALKGISLRFEAGKVHALIGKNGAGKSTLVKILSGATQPTQGKVLLNGQEVQIRRPDQAFQNGIATVYQDLSLVPELTVGENILFGRLPKKNQFGGIMIDWPKVFEKAKEVLANLHIRIDVGREVWKLGMAQQ